MIKIAKDLSAVPSSLLEAKMDEMRSACLSEEKYLKRFNNNYKKEDTKQKLKEIYADKCVFCEQKVITCVDNRMQDCTSTVEHYRPKSSYYWLAFSWDNLLLCCNKCNQNKDNNFEILHDKIEYDEAFNENIHSSTVIYNEREEPKIIHPEIESVIQKLTFNNGIISSTDNRVKYTIKTCGIDRDVLNESRKKILKSFLDSVNKRIVLGQDYDDIIKNLMDDIKQKQKEFIALRFWIYQNYESLLKGQI